MSSQLEKAEGTNPRNDATAENSTSKLCGSLINEERMDGSQKRKRDDFNRSHSLPNLTGTETVGVGWKCMTDGLHLDNETCMFCRRNWDEADSIFKLTKNISTKVPIVKGFQEEEFRQCKKIKSKIDSGNFTDLELILLDRSLFNYRLIVKRELRKREYTSPQAGWDPIGIVNLSESIRTIGQNATEITSRLEDKVDQMNEVGNRISTLMTNAINSLLPSVIETSGSFEKVSRDGLNINHIFDFTPIFNSLNDPTQASIIAGVIYLFIEIIDRKYELPNLCYLKMLLGAFLVYKVGTGPLGVRLYKTISDWLSPSSTEAQAEWSDWLSVGVQGTLFCVFGATVDTTTLVKLVKSLGDSASSAMKLQELFTNIVEWLKKTADIVFGAFGIELYDWLKPQDVRLHAFMKRVNLLLARYNENPMSVGLEFAEDVTKLLMEINDYMTNVPVNSKNSPVINAVKDLQAKMQTLSRNVADAGMALGERNEPAFCILAGAPGSGKTYFSSFLSQYLVINAAETPDKVIDAQRNWKANVYVWPTDNKHHDQYKGEMVTVYPDLFCLTDAEGQPSEASGIVYIVGGQPFQLPAAELTKKQRLFFISQIILACTNITYIHDHMFKSIRNPDAVKRRANRFGYFMWVNPKYAMRDSLGNILVDPSTNKVKGYEADLDIYGQLDKNKLPQVEVGVFPEDIWFFRKLNFTTGMFADGKIFKVAAYLKLVDKFVTDTKNEGNIKKANMDAHGAKLCAEKLESLLNPQAQAGDIEFEMAEDRDVSVKQATFIAPGDLAIEARERLERKDVLDRLRLEQMIAQEAARLKKEQKSRRVEEKVEEESYFSSDEYDEIVVGDVAIPLDGAQMDDESREMHGDMFEEYDKEALKYMLPDVKTTSPKISDDPGCDPVDFVKFAHYAYNKNNPTFEQYEASIKFHHEANEVDSRFSWKDYASSLWKQNNGYASFTREQHKRMGELLIEACKDLEIPKSDINDPMILANRLAGLLMLRHAKFNGMCYCAIKDAISRMDEELGSVTKQISTLNILILLSVSYEKASKMYMECVYLYMIKDPFLRALTKAQDFIVGNISGFLKPVTDIFKTVGRTVMKDFCRMLNNETFYICFQAGMMSITSTTCMLMSLMFCNWLFTSKKKKPHKQVKAQAAWTSSEATKQTIDKHMVNMCGLYVVVHRGEGKKTYVRHPCNVVFLGGKTCVIVDHARQAILKIQQLIEDKPDHFIELVLVPFIRGTIEDSTERCKLSNITFESSKELELKDLCIMKFPSCANRPHLDHLLAPKECVDWISGKMNLEGIFIERTTDMNLVFNGPEIRRDVAFDFGYSPIDYIASFNYDGNNYKVSDYSYKAIEMTGRDRPIMTRAGYCMSPGFLTDERKNFCTNLGWKQAQQPWLIYFHTSLFETCPNGTPVYKELFTPWIEEMKKDAVKTRPVVDVINENMEEFSRIIEEELEAVGVGQSSSYEVRPEITPMDARHTSCAIMDHSIFQPVKSEIRKSPLYGIEPRTRYPSRMGRMKTLDGQMIDIMEQTREPYGKNSALLDYNIIEEIMHQAMDRVMSDSSVTSKKEILSLDQALYGDGAYKLNSVNWNSSAGFYFRMLKDKYGMDWKGKRWMLEEDGLLKPEIKRVIERMLAFLLEKVEKGERIYGINIDNLKDELLAKEKVLLGKTRLFCTNDFIVLLLCKMYMGSFAGWIFENRIKNGIAIGVNPLSTDWDSIVAHLMSNSPDMAFLDHSKFDKDQLRQIMGCVLILMDKFYGPEHSLIRKVLFEDILSSIHVTMYKGKLHFYCWKQGNTSGNFLTAILNSLVNICYMYMICIFAWLINQGINPLYIKTLPKNPADKALKYIILGDDIVLSINKLLMPGVNFNTIVVVAKYFFNLTITDELKSGNDIPDFRPITDGSFLGRGFIPRLIEGRTKWCALLRRYSRVEKVQWIKGIYDPEIEVAKIEDLFCETTMDTKEEFDKIVSVYAPACKKAYGIYPKFTDYEVARRHVLALSEYKYTFGDFVDEEAWCDGVTLEQLLYRIKERDNMERYQSGKLVTVDTMIESDCDVKLTRSKVNKEFDSLSALH